MNHIRQFLFSLPVVGVMGWGLAACSQQESEEGLFKKYEAKLTEPRSYDCYRVTEAIKIDGKLDEASWQRAALTDEFVDISGFDMPKPTMSTRARMLWDDEKLYIAAEIQEENIIARLQQRDTIIYHDNDFEVFIDPDGDAINYFEFENNARGVLFDLLLDRAYRSDGSFFIPWDCKGWELAVSYDGTLNKADDKDRAWYVEMAIPFASLKRDFAEPTSYKVWRLNFSRVEWLKAGGPEENWVWSPTGEVNMHMPERWGFLRFVDAPVGTEGAEAPELPYDMNAYRLVWAMFYAQKDYQGQHNDYMRTLEDFALGKAEKAAIPAGGQLDVEAMSTAFRITLTLPDRNQTYTINQDGRFRVQEMKSEK